MAAAIGTCVLVAAPAALAITWAGPETSPTTSPLYGVSCPDTSHCFAVGGTTSAGKIIDTVNAAAASPTWSTQTPPSGATGQYNEISCADDNHCIVVGNTAGGAPLIVATSNGGSTWTKQTPPSSATVALQGVSCPSSTRCVAVGNVVGSSPVIIATIDGGSPWTAQTAPATNAPLNDVNCPSTTTCYAVGGSSSVATLLDHDQRRLDVDRPDTGEPRQPGAERRHVHQHDRVLRGRERRHRDGRDHRDDQRRHHLVLSSPTAAS